MILLLTLLPGFAPQQPPAPVAARVPVLVELFTSEGWSSCPSADAVLLDLAERQPIEGVEVIALGQHVDYWNRLGWKDPYSSHSYTKRQGRYRAQFGAESIYTPQAVVDGQAELVDSKKGAF